MPFLRQSEKVLRVPAVSPSSRPLELPTLVGYSILGKKIGALSQVTFFRNQNIAERKAGLKNTG